MKMFVYALQALLQLVPTDDGILHLLFYILNLFPTLLSR